ncbi:MAG TPA: hypothetical protein VGF43_15280, partial [Dongiaceae bacterium]
MSEGSLDQLCDSLGIATRYRDHTGTIREVPEGTLRSLLDRLQSAQTDAVLPPVIVHRQGRGAITVTVRHDGDALRWILDGDQGSAQSGWVDPATRRIALDGAGVLGQYELKVYCGDIVVGTCPVIIAPAQAFLPPLLQDGAKLWGLATQL